MLNHKQYLQREHHDHYHLQNRLLKDGSGKIKGFSYYDSEYRYSYNNLAFDADDTDRYSFEDDDGHGSHVAGIVCNLTPNNVKILPIKVLGDDGLGKCGGIFTGFALTVTYDTHSLGAKPKFRIFLPQPRRKGHPNGCPFSFIPGSHFEEPMFSQKKRNIVHLSLCRHRYRQWLKRLFLTYHCDCANL